MPCWALHILFLFLYFKGYLGELVSAAEQHVVVGAVGRGSEGGARLSLGRLAAMQAGSLQYSGVDAGRHLAVAGGVAVPERVANR